jgi:DNA repair protein RecN (Recombination protein N)
LVSPILTADLKELGMPDAELSVSLESAERIPTGQDKVEIKFTSNKGQSLQDISKVASGGELSRLMLSLKAEMADNTQLPAIIFDEIDTGVSGDVADKVGVKIKSLSSKMQVLCITHLPQIASKADQHYYVYKEQEEGRTVTGIRPLEKSDRIVEIAKMLSTANPTDAALEHAKNLVEKTA